MTFNLYGIAGHGGGPQCHHFLHAGTAAEEGGTRRAVQLQGADLGNDLGALALVLTEHSNAQHALVQVLQCLFAHIGHAQMQAVQADVADVDVVGLHAAALHLLHDDLGAVLSLFVGIRPCKAQHGNSLPALVVTHAELERVGAGLALDTADADTVVTHLGDGSMADIHVDIRGQVVGGIVDLVQELLLAALFADDAAAVGSLGDLKGIIGQLCDGEAQLVHAGDIAPVVHIVAAGTLTAALQQMACHDAAGQIVPIVSSPAKLVLQRSQEQCAVSRTAGDDHMLCDIEMPMESGLDLLDWLRQRGMTTRCIFLTAHAEFKYAQEALRLGGFDYIMQPAPYEQVADAVSRALDNVKEEWAALELQSRGAVFDDQKKEIVETMLRGFLLGNAPGSSLTAFEELSLVPRRERECWVALMQPLRWKQGEEPWELSLLSTAVGNMSSEVFTPLQVLSVTVAIPAEQCLVLVLQSRVGEPLEADYITRQLNYLQSACAQYINCEAAFYPEGPQPFEQASEIYQKLLQQRSENVALKGGVLLGRPAEKAPEVFRIPQIGAWQKLLQAGCAQAMEQEACQLLDKLTANNQLNSQTLRYFYQDFMQMLFSLPEKKRQDDMFREPEALELYRNGMKTVPDMKALVHYVASVWDSETEENSQSTVEIIMAYIAEHLENELRREELAEAVHLNPDYMARLFKKETGLNLKDYIIQQKMQEAQSLLCTTNLPISLIAAKVGYTNFGHFSTSYKKFYHKTPQEERSAAL